MNPIIEHVKKNQPFLENNLEIFEILEGDLLPKLKTTLRGQLVSNRSFEASCKLIPPINIIKRLIDKLTTIYSDPPSRVTEKTSDQLLVDYYSPMLNTAMNEANRFFNSMKSTAIEPYIDNGEIGIRVISGHQCLPYSSNPINPMMITEFIKFVGEMEVNKKMEKVLFVYSNENFKAINMDGESVGLFPEGNPIGIIPQTYIKRSRNLLIPKADSDLLQMGLLIPTMIAHLNFAAHMQSHSIIYGIDVDATNLDFNPDAFVLLKTDAAGVKPEIGVISPKVNITEVWESIDAQLQMWFETRSIRAGQTDGQSNSISGIALMIKEMDATTDLKDQVHYFQEAESEFWEKMKIIHNFWVDSGLVVGMPKFSPDCIVSVDFSELKPFQDKNELIDQQIKLINSMLTSRSRARAVIHDHLTTKELELLDAEIEEEFGAKEYSVNEDPNIETVRPEDEASDSE